MRHGRLPWPRPDELDAAGRDVYEAIAGGPRAAGPRLFAITDSEGRLEGPFNAMVLAPSVGMALQDLGAAIRYRTALSDRVREVAILVLASHRRSDFEAYAHEAVGRAVGLTDHELMELRAGRAASTLSSDEQLAHRVCTLLFAKRALPDEVYREAVDALGTDALLEIVTLIGYYDTLDLMMSVAETPLPDGAITPFASEGV